MQAATAASRELEVAETTGALGELEVAETTQEGLTALAEAARALSLA